MTDVLKLYTILNRQETDSTRKLPDAFRTLWLYQEKNTLHISVTNHKAELCILAKVYNAITRLPLKLESCSNHLRIQQVS